jgi:FtsP/CotA-like multicopper oxidase with cupredoxin domain
MVSMPLTPVHRHIHGHHFQILAILPPQWFVREQKDALALWNFVASRWTSNITNSSNPPRLDTIWLEKSVTYVVAIKPDNPGVCAFHCHNDIWDVAVPSI